MSDARLQWKHAQQLLVSVDVCAVAIPREKSTDEQPVKKTGHPAGDRWRFRRINQLDGWHGRLMSFYVFEILPLLTSQPKCLFCGTKEEVTLNKRCLSQAPLHSYFLNMLGITKMIIVVNPGLAANIPTCPGLAGDVMC